MALLTNPSVAFSTALTYITVGTLVDIWTIVAWIFYPPASAWGQFLVIGFLASGFAVLVIGLLLGPIGRAARNAELPPTEVTAVAAQAEQTAAANPPPVVPANAPMVSAPNPVRPPPQEAVAAAVPERRPM